MHVQLVKATSRVPSTNIVLLKAARYQTEHDMAPHENINRYMGPFCGERDGRVCNLSNTGHLIALLALLNAYWTWVEVRDIEMT